MRALAKFRRAPGSASPEFRLYLLHERGLASSTIRAYCRDLEDFLAFFGRPFDRARENDVRAWIQVRGGSAPSTTRRMAVLRAYARSRSVYDPTSTLSRPKRRAGLPRPVADLPRVLSEMDPRERACAVFLAETGLRISEACAVSVDEPTPAELIVHGKGGRDRVVPLSAAARGAISELGGSIGWGPRTVQARFAEYGIHPHALRHTFACELAAAGCDLGEIQDLLGHSSPATTRVYAAYGTERLRAAIDRRAASQSGGSTHGNP